MATFSLLSHNAPPQEIQTGPDGKFRYSSEGCALLSVFLGGGVGAEGTFRAEYEEFGNMDATFGISVHALEMVASDDLFHGREVYLLTQIAGVDDGVGLGDEVAEAGIVGGLVHAVHYQDGADAHLLAGLA